MKVVAKLFFFCFLAGCASKYHCRELTDTERREMTCREIDIEIARIISSLEVEDKNFNENTWFWGPTYADFVSKEPMAECSHGFLKQLQDLKAEKGCVNDGTKTIDSGKNTYQPQSQKIVVIQ